MRNVVLAGGLCVPPIQSSNVSVVNDVSEVGFVDVPAIQSFKLIRNCCQVLAAVTRTRNARVLVPSDMRTWTLPGSGTYSQKSSRANPEIACEDSVSCAPGVAAAPETTLIEPVPNCLVTVSSETVELLTAAQPVAESQLL